MGEKKELNIKIIVNGDDIKTIVQKINFTEQASSQMEVIGLIENLKQIELAKVNKIGSINLNR
jgi:hypothetical protein